MADTILRVLLELRRHGVEVRNLVVTALPSLPSYPLSGRGREERRLEITLCVYSSRMIRMNAVKRVRGYLLLALPGSNHIFRLRRCWFHR